MSAVTAANSDDAQSGWYRVQSGGIMSVVSNFLTITTEILVAAERWRLEGKWDFCQPGTLPRIRATNPHQPAEPRSAVHILSMLSQIVQQQSISCRVTNVVDYPSVAPMARKYWTFARLDVQSLDHITTKRLSIPISNSLDQVFYSDERLSLCLA